MLHSRAATEDSWQVQGVMRSLRPLLHQTDRVLENTAGKLPVRLSVPRISISMPYKGHFNTARGHTGEAG